MYLSLASALYNIKSYMYTCITMNTLELPLVHTNYLHADSTIARPVQVDEYKRLPLSDA